MGPLAAKEVDPAWLLRAEVAAAAAAMRDGLLRRSDVPDGPGARGSGSLRQTAAGQALGAGFPCAAAPTSGRGVGALPGTAGILLPGNGVRVEQRAEQ